MALTVDRLRGMPRVGDRSDGLRAEELGDLFRPTRGRLLADQSFMLEEFSAAEKLSLTAPQL